MLPCLWQALVNGQGWTATELWQVICWGPAALLGEPAEGLQAGSRRWLLFDPDAPTAWTGQDSLSRAANQPLLGRTLRGQIRASGLTAPESWALPATECPSG